MSLMDDTSLAVALGANQPSLAGSPRDTLLAVRPLLEQQVADWARSAPVCCWSALFDTDPVGPQDQPSYLNAVLLVREVPAAPSSAAALNLLRRLQHLETGFGRDRSSEQRWGPRSLDLDLLFWGELRFDHPQLVLPHPRMHLRSFVLEPLLQAMQGTHPPCW